MFASPSRERTPIRLSVPASQSSNRLVERALASYLDNEVDAAPVEFPDVFSHSGTFL